MSTYVTKRAAELGIPVVDAKTPLTVLVRPMDVERSQQKDSKRCALACACERSLPDVKAAFFFRTKAWIEYDDKIVRYQLPSSVQKEIVAFDRSRDMEPGEYHLSPIHGATTLKAARERRLADAQSKRSHQSTGKRKLSKRVAPHKTTNIRGLDDPSYRAR